MQWVAGGQGSRAASDGCDKKKPLWTVCRQDCSASTIMTATASPQQSDSSKLAEAGICFWQPKVLS